MSKRRIEKLIPVAIKSIEEYLQSESKEIDSEFKGYISSFGAGIVLAGLLPTVCFYERKESGAAANRHLLVKAIFFILKNENNTSSFVKVREDETLKDFIIKNSSNEEIKDLIIDAAVALKLAIRTFSFKKSDGKGES